MDGHNVHHFWGISPPVDTGSLAAEARGRGTGMTDNTTLHVLQVAPCDARHTLISMSRAARLSPEQNVALHFTVWEESPEGLARHLLMLVVLLDDSLPEADRIQMLLELHGNALLRQCTADYLDMLACLMEKMLVALFSGVDPVNVADKQLPALVTIATILDISLLKFSERDALVDAVHKWRSNNAFDMVSAWDVRMRRWYGDRYDFRRNMIDWDYHMRMIPVCLCGNMSVRFAGKSGRPWKNALTSNVDCVLLIIYNPI